MNRNSVLGLMLFLFALIMLFFLIPNQVRGWDSKLFPRFVTVWLGLAGIALCFYKGNKYIEPSNDEKLNERNILQLFFIVLLIVAFIVTAEYIGFFVSAALLLFSLMYVFGVRKWKFLILVPVVFNGILYFLLEKVLSLRLPEGIFF